MTINWQKLNKGLPSGSYTAQYSAPHRYNNNDCCPIWQYINHEIFKIHYTIYQNVVFILLYIHK
jgi:hypothetical protein